MSDYKRINDVFSSWLTSGIFTALSSFNVPWKDTVSASNLDISYHGGHSGDKLISPLIDKLLSDDGTLSTDNITKIASAIYTVYGTNWTKLWATLSFDYNPIENYSMTETETTNGTTTGSGTVNETDTNTETRNTTNTQTSTATSTNGVFGFNSSSASNSDTSNGNGTTTTTDGGTVTDDRTVGTTSSNSGSHNETRTMTRSGNIGTVTAQDMALQEREMWNWFFYDVVFNNVDAMLTLSIY